MIEHIHPEGEPTPTLRDLYERKDGSVEVVDWATPKGKPAYPSRFRLTEKGRQAIAEVLRRNAEATLARGTGNEEAVSQMIRDREERRNGEPST